LNIITEAFGVVMTEEVCAATDLNLVSLTQNLSNSSPSGHY